MRLTHLVIRNFRRFAEVSANMDHKVVALVGPNEAGKSTVLDALERLNGGIAMLPRDYPRNDAMQPGIHYEGWFLLRPEDRKVISHIPEASSIRWVVHYVDHLGTISWELRPGVSRDMRPRQAAIAHIRSSETEVWTDQLRVDYEGQLGQLKEISLGSLLSRLAEHLDAANGDLTPSQIALIHEIVNQGLGVMKEREPAQELAAELTRLAELEAEAAPDDAVYDLLQSHVPKFVKFSESDRLLQDEYDLNQVAASVPKALENLLWLAGISVSTLRSAASTPDQGASLQSLLDKANEKLRHVFHASWHQSTITVFLRTDTHPATSVNVLRILMRSDPGGYASIASSSDGMKTFVALRAFIARHSYETKPVLLLDEAESHLHYDAQADLVKVFTRQDVATQVIYSTHSAGCLPPDLGTAIKPVAPVGSDRSTIRSSFWTEGPGLNTLMLALGSTTFAFTPSRYAVVGEGAADVVLLPSLLRAVTGQDELDFQVVPGTSELTASQIVEVDAQAQHVVYLVDSDNGGKKIAAGLRSAGVSTQSIVELGLGTVTDLTLEDLVDRHTYAAAINEELSRSGRSETIVASELPEVRRSYYVSQRFKDIGVKPPNKTLVAARIAELHEAGPRDTTAGVRGSIADASRVEHLRKLYAALATCLGLAEPQ